MVKDVVFQSSDEYKLIPRVAIRTATVWPNSLQLCKTEQVFILVATSGGYSLEKV